MYMGMTQCGHYQGKVGEKDHKCCGGRITKHALVKCYKKGTIEAEGTCINSCAFCTVSHRNINMTPSVIDNKENIQTLIGKAMSTSEELPIKSESVIPEVVPNLSNASNGNVSLNGASNTKPSKTIWQLWAEEIEAAKNKPPVSPEVPAE